MKKYTLTGEYTIIYVKKKTVEAFTHEEALEKFDKILKNTNVTDCSSNNIGWEITDCEIQN